MNEGNNESFLYKHFRAMNDYPEASFILGLGLFLGGGIFLPIVSSTFNNYLREQTERERIKAGYELKVGDLNGNKILDKFYVINGKVAVVELDGKKVVENPSIEDKF